MSTAQFIVIAGVSLFGAAASYLGWMIYAAIARRRGVADDEAELAEMAPDIPNQVQDPIADRIDALAGRIDGLAHQIEAIRLETASGDALASLSASIGAMSSGIEAMTARVEQLSQADPADALARIESRLAALADKPDFNFEAAFELVGERLDAVAATDPTGPLHALGLRIEALSSARDIVPPPVDVTHIAAEIAAMLAAGDAASDATGEDLPERLSGLEEKIETLAAQLQAALAERSDGDPVAAEAAERLGNEVRAAMAEAAEERAALAGTMRRIMETLDASAPDAILGDDPDAVERIDGRLSEVLERLDRLETGDLSGHSSGDEGSESVIRAGDSTDPAPTQGVDDRSPAADGGSAAHAQDVRPGTGIDVGAEDTSPESAEEGDAPDVAGFPADGQTSPLTMPAEDAPAEIARASSDGPAVATQEAGAAPAALGHATAFDAAEDGPPGDGPHVAQSGADSTRVVDAGDDLIPDRLAEVFSGAAPGIGSGADLGAPAAPDVRAGAAAEAFRPAEEIGGTQGEASRAPARQTSDGVPVRESAGQDLARLRTRPNLAMVLAPSRRAGRGSAR